MRMQTYVRNLEIAISNQQQDTISTELEKLKEGLRKFRGLPVYLEGTDPQKPNYHNWSLNHAMGEIILKAKTKYPKISQMKIHTDYSDCLPLIEFDKPKIETALIEILKNATEAIDEDVKGKIHIETNKIEAGNQSYARIKVRDNGRGIDGNPDRLFTPFHTGREQHGTGLGLFIVEVTVADIHHGKVTIDSEAGQGTTIEILLPLIQKGDSTA